MTELTTLWQRANTRNVNFESLYGGQFMSSTQLMIKKLPCYTLFRNLPPLIIFIRLIYILELCLLLHGNLKLSCAIKSSKVGVILKTQERSLCSLGIPAWSMMRLRNVNGERKPQTPLKEWNVSLKARYTYINRIKNLKDEVLGSCSIWIVLFVSFLPNNLKSLYVTNKPLIIMEFQSSSQVT